MDKQFLDDLYTTYMIMYFRAGYTFEEAHAKALNNIQASYDALNYDQEAEIKGLLLEERI